MSQENKNRYGYGRIQHPPKKIIKSRNETCDSPYLHYNFLVSLVSNEQVKKNIITKIFPSTLLIAKRMERFGLLLAVVCYLTINNY
ncbi:hypothetical protein BN59_03821 [Legionella massiliensis]|uniref:Uncharacterized protein n=1 Tax=Legionella massiliensis TaxID=1034943 RepID=A0A078L6H2_9GAMM|nr:hypothetical protein [Legionella massiliensis]CDZ79503.1 hypothetical protein BN59_03821 [Legionella massiliensis]CEE15241.1 hypothetical protein BN1094_03821 [Legionella massiliensis]